VDAAPGSVAAPLWSSGSRVRTGKTGLRDQNRIVIPSDHGPVAHPGGMKIGHRLEEDWSSRAKPRDLLLFVICTCPQQASFAGFGVATFQTASPLRRTDESNPPRSGVGSHTGKRNHSRQGTQQSVSSLRDSIHKPHPTAVPGYRLSCPYGTAWLQTRSMAVPGLRFVSSLNAKGRLKSLQSSPMKKRSSGMIFDGAQPRDLWLFLIIYDHDTMITTPRGYDALRSGTKN
jgi:hypothetical protein